MGCDVGQRERPTLRTRGDGVVRHLCIRPHPPRTNRTAGSFTRTLLHRQAYAVAYPSSAHLTQVLPDWLQWYNWRHPRGSLGGLLPVSRISQLSGRYT